MINSGRSKTDMIRDPRLIWPFDWDEEIPPAEVYIPTEEEWEELDRKYAQRQRKS
jgi:hypothetical protein